MAPGEDSPGYQLLRVATSKFQTKDSYSLVCFLCCETKMVKISGDGSAGSASRCNPYLGSKLSRHDRSFELGNVLRSSCGNGHR
jgi:hypothetical protein